MVVAVMVQRLKALFALLRMAVDSSTTVLEGIDIVQFQLDGLCEQLSLTGVHAAELLISSPIVDSADASRRHKYRVRFDLPYSALASRPVSQ